MGGGKNRKFLCDLQLAAGACFPATLSHGELNLSQLLAGATLLGAARLFLEFLKGVATVFYSFANISVGDSSTNTYVHFNKSPLTTSVSTLKLIMIINLAFGCASVYREMSFLCAF